MLQRSFRPLTLILLWFVLLTMGGLASLGTTSDLLLTRPLYAAANQAGSAETIVPLPPGCIDGTPAGEESPICCISGIVYIDGEPALGAEVTIQSAHGEAMVQTDHHLTTETRPYYRQSLSPEPLSVAVGDVITLTARFSGYSRTITHTVQGGGQQVDIALAPTLLTFADQTQGEAGDGKFNGVMDVAVDSQGNIYGTDLKNFRVQVFDPAGNWLRQWGGELGNRPTQFSRPLGMAIDQRTNIVYVVDRDSNRILQYSAAGDLIDVWDNGDLPANQPWIGAPKDVSVDGSGNVYLIARSGITKFDETGKLLAHWGAYSDGSSDRADLDHLAASAQGEVYVPDRANQMIHRFDTDGVPHPFLLRTITGTLTLSNPLGIAVDAQNRIYVYDGGRSRLLIADATGLIIDALPRDLINPNDHFPSDVQGITVDNDIAYLAGFNEHRILRLSLSSGNFITPSIGGLDNNPNQIDRPRGLEIGAQGELIITDLDFGHLIIGNATTITKSWSASDFGLPRWNPIDLAFDNQQALWVADNEQQGLLRFAVDGLQLTKSGQWTTVVPNDIQLCKLRGLDIDAQNTIFVINGCNETIYALTLNNGALEVLATLTGSGTSGPLNGPLGIAVDDATNMVYVADSSNHRVVQFAFSGGAFTFVRTWGTEGGGPGQFNQPWTILVGKDGFLYVSDHGNHRIQKFNKDGTAPQILGTSGIGPGDWLNPTGLAMDNTGTLYGADEGLGRVQQLKQVANTAPIATIVKTSATDLRPTTIFTATGQGQDSDATNIIDAYEWSSNVQVVLQSGPNPNFTIAASQLMSGSHIISLRVQDDEDEWSIPVQVRIYVLPDLPPDPCQGEHWTMLLYLDGDYQDGGQLQASYEAAIANLKGVNNACVRVAVQIDSGASIGTTIADSQRLGIEAGQPTFVENVAEQEMDAAATLADFVVWGQTRYPADHFYLAIADHGQGIVGIGWDHTTDYRRNPPLIENDSYLTVSEIATALADPRVETIDILHLDACSMGLLDAAYELRHSARYLLASQYLGWSLFAYADYAALIPQTASITPAQVATGIVNRYADLATNYALPHTLSALDLRQVERIKTGVDALAVLLRGWVAVDLTPSHERAQLLSTLRSGSQLFNSNGDLVNTPTDLYVDLLDWTMRIEAEVQIDDPAIKAAATQLIALLQTTTNPFVLANRTGSAQLYVNNQFINLSHAHGISLYLPPGGQSQYGREYAAYLQNQLYGLTVASRWDSLLQTVLGAPDEDEALAAPPPPLAPLALPTVEMKIFLPVIQR